MMITRLFPFPAGADTDMQRKIMTVELNPRHHRDGRQKPLRLLRWTTAASLIALAPCQAQSAMSQTDMSNAPPAAAADVGSMDAIMHAYYDVISGPAGNRDWNRFYSLFVPGGRLIQTDRPKDSTARTVVRTPQEFAQWIGPYMAKNALYEKEISHSDDTFGAITQRFSTYAVLQAADDAKPRARGIGSAQLFNDGKRWYIVTVMWDNEGPGNPIPSRYLSSK
jgi:hypothetical protein